MPEDRDGPEDRDRPEEDGPPAGIEPTDALELPPSVATSEPVRPPPPPEEIPTFEDVEDITFEPRPPETDELLEPEEVKHFPAPQRPRGTGAPTTLQRRRFATLAAAADVLLPRGGPIEASAMDLGLAERLDRALALYDPAARRSLGRALRFLEWSTVFSRALRPFSRLPVPTRQAAFDRLRRSRSTLRRQAAETVASLAANQWAAHPDVEGALGFTYACVTDDPPRDAEPAVSPGEVEAMNENRRRTRSSPQDGHATWVCTEAVIERRCSNVRSHPRQMYSYAGITPG